MPRKSSKNAQENTVLRDGNLTSTLSNSIAYFQQIYDLTEKEQFMITQENTGEAFGKQRGFGRQEVAPYSHIFEMCHLQHVIISHECS